MKKLPAWWNNETGELHQVAMVIVFNAMALHGSRQINIYCWNNVQVSGSESPVLSHTYMLSSYTELQIIKLKGNSLSTAAYVH